VGSQLCASAALLPEKEPVIPTWECGLSQNKSCSGCATLLVLCDIIPPGREVTPLLCKISWFQVRSHEIISEKESLSQAVAGIKSTMI